ncbi:LCP family protein [Actinomadura violacea]|uniref:LCP family protein n=1 Tax=Actinomadura violacea TaxID=2819934 RepID=A0ABS3RJ74_9ACTN|nr:LCP family protein [Actinomadura violacea]MBO2456636.1 LCP family protein [Actinomadura violacea]
MDDLELLRDLGRELGEEPPPELARQRTRLLDAARGRRRSRLPGGRWTLLGVVAAVTAAAVLVPASMLHGRGARPPAAGTPGAAAKAVNVLVVGSDARSGGPARSDTIVLVHLPADRASAEAVSIPRDSLVDVPACRSAKGAATRAYRGTVNTAYTVGGVPCLLKAVEKATLVPVDAAVEMDFGGFKAIVDALGGVQVTLPKAIVDPRGRRLLPPGRQVVDGEGALVYVRARHGLGDGSDLDRIKRQQQFMAAVVGRAKSGVLADPVRLARFTAAVARSVRTYPRMGVKELEALAWSLRKTGPGAVRFATVPVRPAPEDPNRVVIDRARADRVFTPFRR